MFILIETSCKLIMWHISFVWYKDWESHMMIMWREYKCVCYWCLWYVQFVCIIVAHSVHSFSWIGLLFFYLNWPCWLLASIACPVHILQTLHLLNNHWTNDGFCFHSKIISDNTIVHSSMVTSITQNRNFFQRKTF